KRPRRWPGPFAFMRRCSYLVLYSSSDFWSSFFSASEPAAAIALVWVSMALGLSPLTQYTRARVSRIAASLFLLSLAACSAALSAVAVSGLSFLAAGSTMPQASWLYD